MAHHLWWDKDKPAEAGDLMGQTGTSAAHEIKAYRKGGSEDGPTLRLEQVSGEMPDTTYIDSHILGNLVSWLFLSGEGFHPLSTDRFWTGDRRTDSPVENQL